MQARAPLMIEHRLIERMILVVRRALELVEQTRSLDPAFVDLAVDFIRSYADRTHHGKEEGILFRELRIRRLSEADRRLMDELVAEHAFARAATTALAEANARYRLGSASALAAVAAQLRALVDFYPGHIEKEDLVFFPACRAYLSDEEDQALLAEFLEFDRKVIHEKYRAMVQALEQR